jgi:hypothetical protein
MSDSHDKPASDGTRPAAPISDNADARSRAGPSYVNGLSVDELIANLKENIEQTRLPPEFRDEILAQLPPPEERERLYREIIEQGGISSEEFFASLGLDDEP